MVNIVGEHSASHLKYDPPLMSDIGGLARPLSHWVRRIDGPDMVAWDVAAAVAKASEHPGRIATLILPGDTSWQEAGSLAVPLRATPVRRAPDAARVEEVARVLRSGEPAMIILANKAARGRALELAGQVAAGTHCRLGTQFFTTRIERGAGRVPLERIPYAVALATAFLSGIRHLITVETKEPVAFFAYPGKPSQMKAPGTLVQALAMIDIDRPTIDWVAMGRSMGVPGVRVETVEDFHAAMVRSAQEPGPGLIEVKLY
jgi:acetolactate synthase-1/2/3 large subunit